MKRRTFIGSTAAALALATGRRAGGADRGPSPRLPVSAERASPRAPNLLRNGHFQDDWLSVLPQPQTLHWAYANAFYHRRVFNPDGWRCTGSWQWVDAD